MNLPPAPQRLNHKSRIALLQRAAVLAATLSVTLISPAIPQGAAREELERIEREKAQREERVKDLTQEADQAVKEAERLQRQLVDAARRVYDLEQDVERSEGRLQKLRRDERSARALLQRDREALENVVLALIMVERDRPPTLAITPDNATEAARASILMGLIAPQLNGRAERIAISIKELTDLRASILMQNDTYRKASTELSQARTTVGALIAERRSLASRLRRDADSERARITAIARRASDLRDLIVRLGDTLPAAEGGVRTGPTLVSGNFQAKKGRLPMPATGQLVSRYGKSDDGSENAGIVLRTRPGAQITAPSDARVEFVGPFRTFGQIIILNCGSGHHIVLAGLGTTYATIGQEVLAGEPIAAMSGDRSAVPDLYIEIRKDGETLNPSDWLMAGGL
jgi:murein hydrolase activator